MIDLGKAKAWNPRGLKRLDSEVLRLASARAATRQGVQSLRWYLLDRIVRDPVPVPFESLDDHLRREEEAFWMLLDKLTRGKQGKLEERKVGWLMGYETDSPVRTKKWKLLRERVFARLGLAFGPDADVDIEGDLYDIGEPSAWRYDVIRVLDEQLVKLAEHHAASDVGAQTVRWHVWRELTQSPHPLSLSDIERQLENAEESLMASFSDEVRRVKGHLSNGEVARMIGFRVERPINEGYYRQLREDVFVQLVDGFGVVELPEVPVPDNAIDVGKQGAWRVDELERLDGQVAALCREIARTEPGAQTLRWALLDEITEDPDPVDMAALEQRLCNLDVSVRNLFGALKRKRPSKPFLGDAKIASCFDIEIEDRLTDEHWQPIRDRVVERVDAEGFTGR